MEARMCRATSGNRRGWITFIWMVSVTLFPSVGRGQECIGRRAGTNEDADLAARQAGADQNWWQAVSADIEHREYTASPSGQGFQAPNRAHNLRTTFGESGIEVVPRTGEVTAPAWRFAWTTSAFGRPGGMQEVGPASPQAQESRVVYHHGPVGLVEWYENRKDGLEQGFNVHDRPAGTGPLTIIGSIGGGLRPELRDDGEVDFLDAQGACPLRYGKLQVWDANGRKIDSRLAVGGTGLAVQVEDAAAVYPLTIDPLMTSPAWTAESNQVNAYFGESVATAGDLPMKCPFAARWRPRRPDPTPDLPAWPAPGRSLVW